MTDNEIKKALECCSTYKGKCTDCPAFVKVDRSNCKKVLLGAIEIINRLQSENERLSKITRPLIAEIKAEAYKEFCERLKEKSFQSFGNYGITRDVVEVCDIDNLLKEFERKEGTIYDD